jgi:hypothetical protein
MVCLNGDQVVCDHMAVITQHRLAAEKNAQPKSPYD